MDMLKKIYRSMHLKFSSFINQNLEIIFNILYFVQNIFSVTQTMLMNVIGDLIETQTHCKRSSDIKMLH